MAVDPAIYAAGAILAGPSGVGTDGQVLASDGLGATEWIDVSGGGVTDHGALTGLGDDDHTIYALLAGRAGGQTLIGGTASGDDLTLGSNPNADGKVQLAQGDRLYMSNALGEDSIRLRDYGSGRGWVLSVGGVDTYYFNQDGAFQCTSISTSSIAGLSSLTLSTGSPAMVINRASNTQTGRTVYQTAGVPDWYVGARDTNADYVIESATSGALIRLLKSGAVMLPNLPTADPVVTGVLWNDGGTLKVSAG